MQRSAKGEDDDGESGWVVKAAVDFWCALLMLLTFADLILCLDAFYLSASCFVSTQSLTVVVDRNCSQKRCSKSAARTTTRFI
jgi:hypothetical protein